LGSSRPRAFRPSHTAPISARGARRSSRSNATSSNRSAGDRRAHASSSAIPQHSSAPSTDYQHGTRLRPINPERSGHMQRQPSPWPSAGGFRLHEPDAGTQLLTPVTDLPEGNASDRADEVAGDVFILEPVVVADG